MRIISDTTCHFSAEEAAKRHVVLVANQVTFGNESFRDYLELDEEPFYHRLKTEIARTSQPAVGEVMEAYALTSPEETLHVTTGQGLSSAFDSAQGLKASMNADHVTVFDSQCVAGPNRYLTLLASSLAAAGASLQSVKEQELNNTSMLNWFRTVTDFKNDYKNFFGQGTYGTYSGPNLHGDAFAYTLSYGGQKLTVIVNHGADINASFNGQLVLDLDSNPSTSTLARYGVAVYLS